VGSALSPLGEVGSLAGRWYWVATIGVVWGKPDEQGPTEEITVGDVACGEEGWEHLAMTAGRAVARRAGAFAKGEVVGGLCHEVRGELGYDVVAVGGKVAVG